MVVLPLRERAVAPFHCRRGPLERLGMLRCPRFPTRQHLGLKLSGAWMPLKHLCNRLEHQRHLGFLHRVARAAQLFLPGIRFRRDTLLPQ